MIVILILIVLLAMFQVTMTDYLVNNPDFYQLDASHGRAMISVPCSWGSWLLPCRWTETWIMTCLPP